MAPGLVRQVEAHDDWALDYIRRKAGKRVNSIIIKIAVDCLLVITLRRFCP